MVIAAAMVCGLTAGYSNYSWSGDLDSALENVNISTDARNAAKAPDKDSTPCIKAARVTCVTRYEDTNIDDNQASAIQQAIVRGNIVGNTIPGAIINGAAAGDAVNNGTLSFGGH